MRFTLKDYQTEAVGAVLDNMKKAQVFWQDHDMKTAFSLAATTGSGKTVMAAAVFEALLCQIRSRHTLYFCPTDVFVYFINKFFQCQIELLTAIFLFKTSKLFSHYRQFARVYNLQNSVKNRKKYCFIDNLISCTI